MSERESVLAGEALPASRAGAPPARAQRPRSAGTATGTATGTGRKRWVGWVAVATVLVLWQGTVSSDLISAELLPGPIGVAAAFWYRLFNGYRQTSLVVDTVVTVARCLSGFGLAVILGVPLGLLMGVNRRVSGAFNYIVQFLRPLPPLAYFILLIVWFGTGNLSKVVLLFLTAFPIIASAAMAGVRGVPRLRVQAAEMLGAAPRQIFFQVIMPSAAPMIFTGFKIALAAAFSTVVAAEFIIAQYGLGWMVLSASKFLKNPTVLMGVVLLGLIGMALARGLHVLDEKLIHWRRFG
ncbi:MAG: ABC transporter permease [Acetobacteraceae bacterium]